MPDIRGIHVESGGTYVLMDDVIASIREYAQSLDDPNAGAAIHELASWLGASSMPAAVAGISYEEPVTVTDEEADRVELYPHPPGDEKPKWYARTVDSEGNILYTTAGDFHYENVHAEATARWPGLRIYQLNGWKDDSVFIESQEKRAFPTAAPMRERISPKRMFAT